VHRLTLHGGASLSTPSGPVIGQAAQRRRLALLALLSRSPNYTLSRDKVIALLWPESTTAEARHLLSVSLHALRKELGEDAIRTLGDDLRLEPTSLTVDAWEFDQALIAGEFAKAIELYVGPFLDGVHIAGADEFAKWADDERSEMAAQYADALERAAQNFSESGEAVRAAELWRRRSQLDPYQGRIALAYMRALAASGDRAGAIQHGRNYTNLLRAEFGTEPEPAIRQLMEDLKADPAGAWSPSALVRPAASIDGRPSVVSSGSVPELAPRPRVPRTTIVRSLTLVAAAAGVAALVWILRPAAPLDPNKIVGYPLRDLDATSDDNSRGEEVAVAIGSALELTDQIKWIDGWTMLDGNERANVRNVGLPRQLDLARATRARYSISGQIFDDNSRTTVRLIAHDVAEDTVVAQVNESGLSSAETAVTVSIRALNKMLPRLLAPGGRGAIDLTTGDLTRHPPAALAAWLSAERDYRLAHYQEALDNLMRALSIDSTLGIAALRAATAANWIPGCSRPRPKTRSVRIRSAGTSWRAQSMAAKSRC
jgi:DNA-binding SARP family transcriptional activator